MRLLQYHSKFIFHIYNFLGILNIKHWTSCVFYCWATDPDSWILVLKIRFKVPVTSINTDLKLSDNLNKSKIHWHNCVDALVLVTIKYNSKLFFQCLKQSSKTLKCNVNKQVSYISLGKFKWQLAQRNYVFVYLFPNNYSEELLGNKWVEWINMLNE